ncbi:MAG: hypothetical protein ACYCZR_02775 [Burkholderiales bacterium]
MGPVIDDRNDEWYEFVKHVMEQEAPVKRPIDELIFEALQDKPAERRQTTPLHPG